jgi:hypothetical protein
LGLHAHAILQFITTPLRYGCARTSGWLG